MFEKNSFEQSRKNKRYNRVNKTNHPLPPSTFIRAIKLKKKKIAGGGQIRNYVAHPFIQSLRRNFDKLKNYFEEAKFTLRAIRRVLTSLNLLKWKKKKSSRKKDEVSIIRGSIIKKVHDFFSLFFFFSDIINGRDSSRSRKSLDRSGFCD